MRSVDGGASRKSVDGGQALRSVDGPSKRSVDGAAQAMKSVDGGAAAKKSVDGFKKRTTLSWKEQEEYKVCAWVGVWIGRAHV